MWGSPDVYSNCLTGLSSYAIQEGYTQAKHRTDLVDDIVLNDEQNLLLGQTESTLWLWPQLEHFEDFKHWHGYWNSECEKWFQDIYKGIMAHTRIPLGRSSWKRMAKQHVRSPNRTLDPGSMAHAETLCRRLRRQFPELLASHGLPHLQWEKDSYLDNIQTACKD
ncbi:hypothetical protein JAAARDRAFT_197078 [Jaapia argillacea MUCL 33604]|uniref:Uncharacterized protein n=1 Tax=Jaapia argillacea MUCL 33604 TaxID=933084 RepID=A0A067PGT5_9AGAM|nr:hypothetical protein JAAARDRAFT_197078 [Jaapia argillacea MUCL 33604]